MHRPPPSSHIALLLVLLVTALVGGGCTRDTDAPDTRATSARAVEAPTAQDELDDAMDAHRSDLQLVMDEIPDDADPTDVDAIVDILTDTLRTADGVDRLEQVDDWRITESLRCGTTESPELAIVARGTGRNDFFFGRATRRWIVGFVETPDSDLAAVVARCVDGDSTRLYMVATPTEDLRVHRVAAGSFDESMERVHGELVARWKGEPSPTDLVLDRGWETSDPIDCAPDGETRGVRSADGADLTVRGIAEEEFVAIVTLDAEQRYFEYLATCVDGEAREFRQLANPLDEALDDAE
jgi:hypothetical protein